MDLETFDRIAKCEKIDQSLARDEREKNDTKKIEKKKKEDKSGRKDETRDEIAGAK